MLNKQEENKFLKEQINRRLNRLSNIISTKINTQTNLLEILDTITKAEQEVVKLCTRR